MSYLEEFEVAITGQQFPRFVRLWEEYCLSDVVDGEELIEVLKRIKNSTFAPSFGQIAETSIPMWEQIKEEPIANEVLKLIVDLQTTSTQHLATLAYDHLQHLYGNTAHFNEKIRIVGLRSKVHFQGAITNFELLTHMDKGKFVFHTGGWGVGEVMEISLLREHIVLEFEGITALKDISFANAFKNLIALSSDHFLARRFGDPDKLEQEGRDDPCALIRLVLRDLGPKSAVELKEELSELVIPEEDWTKWWQVARARIKKDTMVKSPKSLKEPFELRNEAFSHEEQFKEALSTTTTTTTLIRVVYHFTRDFPAILKNSEIYNQIQNQLLETLEKETQLSLQLQLTFLLEDHFEQQLKEPTANLIQKVENIDLLLNEIDILAFKKRCLTEVRAHRDDWMSQFLNLLFLVNQNPLRDYLLKELLAEEKAQDLLKERLIELLNKVSVYPEAFFWYFQKIAVNKPVPLNDSARRQQFLEAYMICLHYIELKDEYKDLLKKMLQFITAKRYAVIRDIIANTSVEYLKELLLLASKVSSFSAHDLKILRSLAEVVQPSLKSKKKSTAKSTILWTTQEGYQKVQERIKQIATVETIDNAKEIEAARALGDLRENAEYKAALERRSRLQGELKELSRQVDRARILTKDDISSSEVGVGAVVDLADKEGNKISYTLLGPWDANPEDNILSFQSKIAQAMIGLKKGDSFDFQGKTYTVEGFTSAL